MWYLTVNKGTTEVISFIIDLFRSNLRSIQSIRVANITNFGKFSQKIPKEPKPPKDAEILQEYLLGNNQSESRSYLYHFN